MDIYYHGILIIVVFFAIGGHSLTEAARWEEKGPNIWGIIAIPVYCVWLFWGYETWQALELYTEGMK